MMDMKGFIIKFWNNSLLYIAYILHYLDETKFCLPLDEKILND